MVRATRTRRIVIAALFIGLSFAAVGCDTEEEIRAGIAEAEAALGVDIAAATEDQIVADRLAHLEAVDAANALAAEHDYLDIDTAERVYRIVAADRGWDQATIDRRVSFVRGVMLRESAGCFNLRRGAKFADHTGAGCALSTPGFGTDSGYGQVLMEVHAKWLCPQEGICTPADVTSTPYKSMQAFLALIERSGRSGWCYTAQLRRGGLCRSWPG